MEPTFTLSQTTVNSQLTKCRVDSAFYDLRATGATLVNRAWWFLKSSLLLHGDAEGTEGRGSMTTGLALLEDVVGEAVG